MEKHRAVVGRIERMLERAARGIDATEADVLRRYHGSGQKHLGLRSPATNELARGGYGVAHLDLMVQLPIWDACWRLGRWQETKLTAVHFLGRVAGRDDLRAVWPTARRWAAGAESWNAADDLCGFFVRVLEEWPGLVYPTLCKWNRSGNPWLRRQSIVSLLHYASSRRRVLPAGKILRLVEPLLDDDDRFVQKGVGWTLRECYRVHPAATEQFVSRHLHRISGVAFAAAAERLSPARRAKMIRARRMQRRRG